MMKDVDIDNVGIMSGFTEDFDSTLAEALSDEGLGGEEEGYETGKIMDRKPDSPEILMNNLRGDMRSVDARREELADMVGYGAAMDTPDEVLALLQDHFAMMDQGPAMGIGALPEAPQMPAPPPMAQGPAPQQPPINMAKGGYVQNFALGSDEDGVTPADNTSYGTLAPNLRSQVQDILLKQLQTKNTPVPTRQQAMDEMLPLYQQMLGGDNKANKAAALFALSEGFANLGSKGGSGSFASKMLDSFKGVPTKLGELGMKQKERDQAIKMAALKAGEENRSAIIAANTKADENRVDAAKELLKNSGGAAFEARWEWKTINEPDLVSGFAAGTLDEGDERRIQSAIDKLVTGTSEEYIDPVTKMKTIRKVPGYVPPFLELAIRERHAKFGDMGKYMAALDQGAQPLPGTTPPAPEGPKLLPADEVITPEQIAEREKEVIDRKYRIYPRASTTNYYDRTGVSLFGMADQAAGPINISARMLEEFPMIGSLVDADGAVTATGFIQATKATVANAFSDVERFGFSERKAIEEDLSLLPSLLKNKEAYQKRLVGMDLAMAKGIQSMEATIEDARAAGTLTADFEAKAIDKINAIKRVRRLFGTPAYVFTDEDVAALQPGDYFINGNTGKIQRLKD